MGVGKTSLSKLLQERLKRTAFLSYDQIKWFVSDFKSSDQDFDLTFRVEKAMIKEYLLSGINVVLDKAFSSASLIDELKLLAEGLGAKVYVYQLESNLELAIKRVQSRPHSKRLIGPPTKEQIEQSHSRYLDNKYSEAKTYNTTDLDVKEIIEDMVKEVQSENH